MELSGDTMGVPITAKLPTCTPTAQTDVRASGVSKAIAVMCLGEEDHQSMRRKTRNYESFLAIPLVQEEAAGDDQEHSNGSFSKIFFLATLSMEI